MAISDIAARRTESPAEWRSCATCGLLNSVADVESAALIDLLSDPTVRYSWLAEQLQEDGHSIDAAALSRHARGRCSAKAKLR